MRQTYFDEVAGAGALQQTQSAFVHEAADGGADRTGQTGAVGEPGDGEVKRWLAFKKGMAKQVGIDGAISRRKAETRDKVVLELFPDLCGAGCCVFHELVLCGERRDGTGKAKPWVNLNEARLYI